MKYRTKDWLFTLEFIILITIIPGLVSAGDSELDPEFGINGLTQATVGSEENRPADIAIQSDGKIIQVGSSRNGSTSYGYYINLVRFNTDGSLDTNFGSNGKVSTTLGTYTTDHGAAVAIQSDGKIVVAGSTRTDYSTYTISDIALLRYNSNGSLDTSFSNDGMVIVDLGGAEKLSDIAFQSDGKIIVVGATTSGYDTRFLIMRFNTNGSLDTTFGSSGSVIEHFTENVREDAYSLAVLSDDTIIIAGQGRNSTSKYTVSLLKLTSSGALDSTFHTDGKLAVIIGDSSGAQSVVVDANGKFVVGGFTEATSTSDPENLLLRYNTDGTLDTTFGTNGVATSTFGAASQRIGSLALQANGKVIAESQLRTSSYFNYIGLSRYNANGSLDSTFDNDDGMVTATSDTNLYAEKVILQTDGKIILGAGQYNTSGRSFYYSVFRYGVDNTFTKISSSGVELPDDATTWSCVRNNITGQIWEVKTDANKDALHDHFYTNPISGHVNSINTAVLCGFDDWRVPSTKELNSITDKSKPTTPAINSDYFPKTNASRYWSITPSPSTETWWYIDFTTGQSQFISGGLSYNVRLVRGDEYFDGFQYTKLDADGIALPANAPEWSCIRDTDHKLIWESKNATNPASNKYASAVPIHVDLKNTQGLCGLNNWRVPDIDELDLLVDHDHGFGEPAIRSFYFPTTGASGGLHFWSASYLASNPILPWFIKFIDGNTYPGTASQAGYVRLVHTAPPTPLTAHVTVSDKPYDGTDSATITGIITVSGIAVGDLVSLSGTAVAVFDDVNVGVNKSVTITGLSITGADAADYVLNSPVTSTATISKADQSITFAKPVDQIYQLNATFQAPASSNSTLTVTITSTSLSVCTVSENTITMISTGDCILSASQIGNENYNPAVSISQTVIITLPAPTGLSLANVTDSGMTLTWNDNATTEDGYRVKRNSTIITSSLAADTETFTDSVLLASTTYSYVICAFDTNGESCSSTFDVTTLSRPPANARIEGVTQNTVVLAWVVDASATAYRIKRDGSTINDLAANIATYTDSGLAHSTAYEYQICALNSIGENCSAILPITTLIPLPMAPDNVQSGAITQSSVTLSWTNNPSNEIAYRIYRNSNLIADNLAINVVAYIDDTLNAGTQYSYNICAYNSGGESCAAAFSIITEDSKFVLTSIYYLLF